MGRRGRNMHKAGSQESISQSHGEGQIAPAMPKDRIASLDFIRGLAVLGILLANIVEFSHNSASYYWPPALPGGATTADAWIWLAQYTLVDGKMRGLFAMLFGAGLALFYDRALEHQRGVTLQGRRLFWLALFGMAHYLLLFAGDILFMYATAGFVAILFLQAPARLLLLVGILWALAAGLFFSVDYATVAALEMQALAAETPPPHWPAFEQYWQGRLDDYAAEARVYAEGSYAEILRLRAVDALEDATTGVTLNFFETIPLMLIGMGLFRAGLFTDAGLRARWRKLAWLGAILGAGMLFLIGFYLLRQGFPIFQTQLAFFGATLVFNLPLLLGAILLLTDWSVSLSASWLGERLEMAGRMAFSNYIGTSLVMMLVFQGWAGGLYGQMHRAELLLVVAMGWAMMLTFSRLWLAKFRYGPLEWLWRCLTYWRRFPIGR